MRATPPRARRVASRRVAVWRRQTRRVPRIHRRASRRTSRRRASRRVARDRRVDDRSRSTRSSERRGTARRGDARALGTMSFRPGSKASERKKGFKKAIDADEARRKREGARGDARDR